jgi:pilus assembly protein Flp/PilA
MLSSFTPDRSTRAQSTASVHALAFVRADEAKREKRSMMNKIKQMLAALINDESGQDLIEYALVAGLIGIAAVAAMTGLSGKLGTTLNGVGNSLANA